MSFKEFALTEMAPPGREVGEKFGEKLDMPGILHDHTVI
jgi:hypothetical protein